MKQGTKIILAGVLLLTACVPNAMQSFQGNDIRDVIDYYGVPDNAFDTKEGMRAFQWKVKGAYVTPPMAMVDYEKRAYDTSPWFRAEDPLPLGNTETRACVYTMMARYYVAKRAWMVERYRAPVKRCEEWK